jgi:hypothetical protein
MCSSYRIDDMLKIYVLDDSSSFKYVENYANDIIANWNVCVKCDMNCDLNV